jgi:DNA modification methylase
MVKIIQGDAIEVLRGIDSESVHCCVTSPPYWRLRDYGVEGQLGLEPTPEEYVSKMVDVFREVRRVLRNDGTCWINLWDSYHASGGWGGNETPSAAPGLNPEDLVGIPWRVAFALQDDEWYLRQGIIWPKPNPMPESVTDRCTKSHEYIFLLSKSARYFYDAEAIKEPQFEGTFLRYKRGKKIPSFNKGRNKRSVWTVACILAGCPKGGVVLDPFGGSGTVGMVSENNGRNSILIELNPKYVEMAKRRTAQIGLF